MEVERLVLWDLTSRHVAWGCTNEAVLGAESLPTPSLTSQGASPKSSRREFTRVLHAFHTSPRSPCTAPWSGLSGINTVF